MTTDEEFSSDINGEQELDLLAWQEN